MTTEDNKSVSGLLAKLHGTTKGEVQTPPATKTADSPNEAIATAPKSPAATKPKRDIQELYDFIDKYCEDTEN